MRNAHIVIAAVGSLGDLFPFLAVGQALQAAGHRITVATHAIHQQAIEQAGLVFADASGMAEPEDREAFTAQAFDRWHGPRFVVHDFAAIDVRQSYEKLAPIVAQADVLITITLAFAGQILGEQRGRDRSLHWLSAVLAPAGFLSAYDPPATGVAVLDRFFRASPARGGGWAVHANQYGRIVALVVLAFLDASPTGGPRRCASWHDAPFVDCWASRWAIRIHQGQHRFPAGRAWRFSRHGLRTAEPDWPRNVHLTGFARYAQPAPIDPPWRVSLTRAKRRWFSPWAPRRCTWAPNFCAPAWPLRCD
ncbi:MAG: hypothetical protein WDW36_010301 [Sanguina aurantia]